MLMELGEAESEQGFLCNQTLTQGVTLITSRKVITGG